MKPDRTAFDLRLKESGISPGDIVSMVSKHQVPQALSVYTSHVEGFGTHTSDLDCYVITQDEGGQERPENVVIAAGDLTLDVEFFRTSDIMALRKYLSDIQTLEGTKATSIDFGKLKLLHKLQLAIPLLGPGPWGGAGLTPDEDVLLDWSVAAYFRELAQEELDDAIVFHQNMDFESAAVLARQILRNAVLSYLASQHRRVVKPKWMWRQLVGTYGGDHWLVNVVHKCLVTGVQQANVENDTGELLGLCRDLLVESQV